MQPDEALPKQKRVQPRQTVLSAQIPEARLKIQTVIELTGLSASGVRRKVAEKKFPAPIKDGPRCTRWIAADVMAYLRRNSAAV